jgi:hypothetical protein
MICRDAWRFGVDDADRSLFGASVEMVPFAHGIASAPHVPGNTSKMMDLGGWRVSAHSNCDLKCGIADDLHLGGVLFADGLVEVKSCEYVYMQETV